MSRHIIGLCTAAVAVSFLVGLGCQSPTPDQFGRPSEFGRVSDVGAPRGAKLRSLSLPADGTEYSAPTKVRTYRLTTAETRPYCLTLPGVPDEVWPPTFTDVITATFTTASTTSLINLRFSGQFTVETATDPDEFYPAYNGIVGHAAVTQSGTTQPFPGIGDTFDPYLARRDNDATGQQIYGGYEGSVAADPDTSTTVTVQMYSTRTPGSVCFFNMTVSY